MTWLAYITQTKDLIRSNYRKQTRFAQPPGGDSLEKMNTGLSVPYCIQEEFQGLVSDLMSQLGGISMKGAAAVAATDATTPALRKLESTAIANSTPISYNPRELLILMHEHLLASGLPGVLASSSVDRFLANSLPSWTQNGLASPT